MKKGNPEFVHKKVRYSIRWGKITDKDLSQIAYANLIYLQ